MFPKIVILAFSYNAKYPLLTQFFHSVILAYSCPIIYMQRGGGGATEKMNMKNDSRPSALEVRWRVDDNFSLVNMVSAQVSACWVATLW